MCGFCNVWMFVYVGFVICENVCVGVWICGFCNVCVCVFCNVLVCLCGVFVMCGCVYVWIL